MKIKTVLLTAITFLAVVASAPAAYESYFRADDISGDSIRTAWTGHTAVIGYTHEVSAVRDSNGQPTGKRQHAPFKILKEVSVNSPQFAGKLVRNQAIATADLLLMKTDANGVEINHYTYHFTGVKILSIRNWVANSAAAASATYDTRELEEISFTYETIEWESLTARRSATDSVRN